MPELTRPSIHDDYTVGWICALPETELLAAAAMLDEKHPMLPAADPRDTNSYLLGSIGPHNIVIACLPAQTTGKVSAATVANNLSRSFPAVRFGLMVGTGGGAPYYGSNDEATSDYSEEEDSEEEEEEDIRDIRLGDVVVSLHSKVSEAVVQYDFGKSIQGSEFVRAGGRLDKPPAIILSAISMLQQQHRRKEHRIAELMADAGEKNPGVAAEFKCPGAAKDRLFKSEVVHVEGKRPARVCGRDNINLVLRKERTSPSSEIHYGTIGSADQVMKNALLRDKWGRSEGILCFEMESAGLMDSFPCLVVRGICDYADSHKSKIWQSYAAATAAAYAKELILVIPEQGIMRLPPVRQRRTRFPVTAKLWN
ncbi:nucleoside phosphorylase domain-containing protein [Aspergillus granulosus]|uniref:Nucleoside phosphorylase domain-containing protein n=1 Tax=Aspergillus granulosus TaxID=176169 RepID=A0ABR4HAE6_9EURO